MKTFIKEIYESYKTDGVPHVLALEYTISDIYQKLVSEGLMNEDLRKWFGNATSAPHEVLTRFQDKVAANNGDF